ncbi:BCCT transporter [Veronia nyctiphanis]|uniref:BCCT transporter n=1 Tax=Veronia nyctiphanis TaxID=1278244 RepID=A0A4Q0YRC1_9GAMM|nr:BCCT family transporter [Veronia nyctiphanis]RXJ73652.1 BCCT transporter [Veronia nyctiphanis]
MLSKTPDNGDKLVPQITISFISLFLFWALLDMQGLSQIIQGLFEFSTQLLGAAWQWMLLLNFIIASVIAVSRFGKLRLGNSSQPDISTFRWLSMIMCTLIAGGGVFWSAAEPIFHFTTLPPAFSHSQPQTPFESVGPALAQSFLHWGFLAWAALGTLSAIILMYAHYKGGLKLRPRALLYPLFGGRLENHWLGSIIDAFSIISVAAGTIGPIGFLCLQMGYSLEAVTGIANTPFVQLCILAVVVAVYSLSAASGVDKGLQWLSKFNVIGASLLMLAVLFLGPTTFILEQFGQGFSTYLLHFGQLALTGSNPEWNQWWTWFFWSWFIGFAPVIAIFVARISSGRTIRELVCAVAICAPVVTNFWFTVLGGTGIFFELQTPGSISDPLAAAGLPAVLIASLSQLPLASILLPSFMLLSTTFVVTTGDSMAYSIAASVSGDSEPTKQHRLFWAIAMGLVAGVLLQVGESGLKALQSFIVITAVPVSALLATTLIGGPLVVYKMGNERQQCEALPTDCAVSVIS